MISVIIPLYNKEKIIERTLQSVLSQDYDDYEVVIVDDGSTDKSVEIVKNLLNQQNLRDKVRLISQSNGGPSKARNTGVKNANGEWIVFLDADDELLPGALKRFADIATAHGDADIIEGAAGVHLPDGRVIDDSERKLDGYSKDAMRDWFFRRVCPGADHSMFSKSLIEKYPYDERLRRYEDAELLMRILSVARVYSIKSPMNLAHAEFSCASNARRDINDDYVGHLKMEGPFWKRMCVFRTYIEEREHYSEQCHRLYPSWYWRYDLLMIMKLLDKFKKYL